MPAPEAAFGSPATYSDAVRITIGAPQPFQPSRSALTGGDFPHYIRLTIDVVNGSDRALRLDEFAVGVLSGGQDGVQVVEAAPSFAAPKVTWSRR